MASYQRQNKRNDIGKPKKKGERNREKKIEKKIKTNETKTRTFKQFFFNENVIIKRDRIVKLTRIFRSRATK